MTLATQGAELVLIPSPEARSPRAGESTAERANPAPRRMTKRCRRCGKTVPTVAGLAWRARRLAAGVDSAAGSVFRARVESTDAAQRDDLLRSAHRAQQDAVDETQKLVSDLKRLQSHDRRCHPAQPGARGGQAPGEAR